MLYALTFKTVNMRVVPNYQGFDYAASELSAYAFCLGIFIISLKNGRIIRFEPADDKDFKKWLGTNNIRDIDSDRQTTDNS